MGYLGYGSNVQDFARNARLLEIKVLVVCV